MLAFTITDVKDFMNQLLIGDTFDSFSLVEASIVTFNTFTIDGRLQKDFFDTDAVTLLEENHIDYSPWHDVKPYCFSVIRGKRTPLSFKIIFRLSKKNTRKLMEQNLPELSPELIGGLYLNLQYRNNVLLCTTGVSFSSFLLDKRPEQLWDSMVKNFLRQHNISCQQS